jgi:hypothetical protein
MRPRAIAQSSCDNVAVAVEDLEPGARLAILNTETGAVSTIVLRGGVGFGHKVALAALEPGDAVIKRGHEIGRAVVSVRAGDHVHIHNLESAAG